MAGIEEELPLVAVERAVEAKLDERWAGVDSAEPIFARSGRDGGPFLRIERADSAGYRVWANGYGTHLISADGAACSSALPPGPAWRGRRLLASQAMPLMATLHGREVMHAAGVVIGERLVALAAPSGTGKSSTACNLIAQGGRFFADDVLALEVVDGRVRAHPGPRLVSVHARDLDAISRGPRARIGRRLHESDKVFLEPIGYPGALQLSAMVFLERRPQIAATVVSPLDDVPARLLGNAFLSYLDAPDRLQRQLEVASVLARTVPLARLDIAGADGAAAVARTVVKWVETLR